MCNSAMIWGYVFFLLVVGFLIFTLKSYVYVEVFGSSVSDDRRCVSGRLLAG